jgi:hypothetical protein
MPCFFHRTRYFYTRNKNRIISFLGHEKSVIVFKFYQYSSRVKLLSLHLSGQLMFCYKLFATEIILKKNTTLPTS